MVQIRTMKQLPRRSNIGWLFYKEEHTMMKVNWQVVIKVAEEVVKTLKKIILLWK